MAATVAHSQALPPGLHPLQVAAMRAAANGQQQQQQQSQQSQQRDFNDEPFDVTSRKLTVSDLVRVRTLGTGTFARVCLVRPSHGTEADRSKVYALKILRKTEVIKLKQIDHVRHERQILADVRGHPFITNYVASFSDHEFLYILLDYVPGGELFTYLRKFRRFDEDMARFYAAEIVLILEHLHEHQGGIAYRDMKPENLLLDGEGHIKLVDFGFAKRLGNNESGHPVETYTLCGTPEYLAPEVIHNKGHTTAVDCPPHPPKPRPFPPSPSHPNHPTPRAESSKRPIVFPQEPVISDAAKDIHPASFATFDRFRRPRLNFGGAPPEFKAHPFFAGVRLGTPSTRSATEAPSSPRVRYPGDAQCFDIYPEEDAHKDEYTDEMVGKYDAYFKDF
ncbi:hypothetical protein CHGG_06350 [Chaetomium globosum CBS 148.51]|uniref:cAMP-dependent protein kinase n=1 Tax=Chaetomium globosum (strain ATCC 6205 / CBS 148.51 / DSM 1962 / NBRC 6347 / NRRL 1970) TaxID=306901 RepID=Q2H4R5_CHAGB|nr:uncharacterized protein CHGG_06350 [Chaetomium globosum CBS 148.51]EAQ89731.1 hypothetical protein CHGG_06350 [Chaetomium globosum CBS 148.51]